MDKTTKMLILFSILITLIAVVINIYLGGIVVMIAIVIVMARLIMQDSTSLPEIDVQLKDDAKGIVISNTGNSVAEKIHVALVPINIEFDIPSLAADSSYEYLSPTMIDEVKVVVRFGNDKDEIFSRTFSLSATKPEYDPFKPMVPMFRWKK